MKLFLKWTLKSAVFMVVIIGLTYLSVEDPKGDWPTITLVGAGGAIFFGGLFYFLETKYIPWRKVKLTKKLIALFDGERIEEGLVKFRFENLDFYAELKYQLSFTHSSGGTELICFHIPKTQFDQLIAQPNLKLTLAECNGEETYQVYVTNSLGLRLFKKRMGKKLAR